MTSILPFFKLPEHAARDALSIISPGAGFLKFTKVGDTSVMIHLRLDMIHGYAPVGNELELFYGQHVWKVKEHYTALQAVLSGDWATLIRAWSSSSQPLSQPEIHQNLSAFIAGAQPYMPGWPDLAEQLALAKFG